MKETPPHLKALEEIEKEGIPGLVEVLREEGIDTVKYALWDATRAGTETTRTSRRCGDPQALAESGGAEGAAVGAGGEEVRARTALLVLRMKTSQCTNNMYR
jgi:hypothetical protein